LTIWVLSAFCYDAKLGKEIATVSVAHFAVGVASRNLSGLCPLLNTMIVKPQSLEFEPNFQQFTA
jgi:hypothetical protein